MENLLLKIQPFFTRGIRQRLDTTVILISAAVEYNFLDILSQRPLRDACAYLLSSLDVPAVLQTGLNRFFRGGSSDKRLTRRIVNELRVNMAQALKYDQPRFIRRTIYIFSNSRMPSLSGLQFALCHVHSPS